MTSNPIARILAFCLVAAFALSACDASEQNITWEPGSSLAVVGPITAGGTSLGTTITLAEGATRTAYFYVRGYNSDRTYAWTVNGQGLPSLQGGEFTTYEFSTPGTYTIEVSNGQFSGTRSVTVVRPG